MFEYVTKAEYKPYRQEVEEIIRRAQNIMKTKYDTTFQFKLIGSASRHLITKIKNGNRGYDFDYNLILQRASIANPKSLKDQFMHAFSEAVKRTPYSMPEDSTSSITIKVVDQAGSRILRSIDLAIIYYPNEDVDEGYMYLKNWKNGRYSFEQRKLSQNIEWKLNEILEYSDGWTRVRDEYLKLKNKNEKIGSNKKSFILYLESVHNVYNQIQQDEIKEEEEGYNPFCLNLSRLYRP